MKASDVEKALKRFSNRSRAKIMLGFYRTAKGEYGAGDKFLGPTVPQSRLVAREFQELPLPQVAKLMDSPWHEVRLVGLVIVTERARRCIRKKDETGLGALFRFYVKKIGRVNNWDLVDLSAPGVVGAYLLDRDDAIRRKWLRSKKLWLRRIAYVSLLHDVRSAGRTGRAFEYGAWLLEDKEDLMHKALGWVLREAGMIHPEALEEFIQEHGPRLPRTALRYAIEKMPLARRKQILLETKASARLR